ncbi:hypothetical protein ACIRYZ_37540 [Kitasatospora sp. NPDC101155]|uniref:hypothetical protein n=1 Tax=Kitasatospora sp. NPDC101155 TaxID=3364097 RepID=UPI0038062B94
MIFGFAGLDAVRACLASASQAPAGDLGVAGAGRVREGLLRPRLRGEGQAGKTAVTGVSDILSLTGISWSTDADRAVGDLSMLDGRFDKAVPEAAVERFLEEWVMNDGSLDFTSVRTVDRTVMRDAVVRSVTVRTLVSRDPIVFRVAVDAEGVCYEVDRRSEQVLRGDARKRRPITFAFDLRRDDTSTKAWTVIAADVQ